MAIDNDLLDLPNSSFESDLTKIIYCNTLLTETCTISTEALCAILSDSTFSSPNIGIICEITERIFAAHRDFMTINQGFATRVPAISAELLETEETENQLLTSISDRQETMEKLALLLNLSRIQRAIAFYMFSYEEQKGKIDLAITRLRTVMNIQPHSPS